MEIPGVRVMETGKSEISPPPTGVVPLNRRVMHMGYLQDACVLHGCNVIKLGLSRQLVREDLHSASSAGCAARRVMSHRLAWKPDASVSLPICTKT